MTVPLSLKAALREKAENLLFQTILPFWSEVFFQDPEGRFPGEVSNGNKINPKADRGLVMTARLLWAYSALYNRYGKPEFARLADRAWSLLREDFWDRELGGFYWRTDVRGKPTAVHKQVYGQAFVLYALSEYLLGREDPEMRSLAADLFRLLEDHARDPIAGGYWEACDRNWRSNENWALSPKDKACAKSMNTHLHVLEAYTTYLKVQPEAPQLREAVAALVRIHFAHIVNASTGHLELYFERNWKPLEGPISYGHDIEASWLIWEALEVLGDEPLKDLCRPLVLKLYTASLEGYTPLTQEPGTAYMANEKHHGRRDNTRVWWVQAESAVGMVNAYALDGAEEHLSMAEGVVNYIAGYQVCPQGEWYWALDDQDRPVESQPKAGEWKANYHNIRFCLELIGRLS